MQDISVIDTRRRINDAVQSLFSILAEDISRDINLTGNLPSVLNFGIPKISKGENYLGYPWIMMDYPALFHKSGSLALRNMFWWGHHFSVTLHVSGQFKDKYKSRLIDNLTHDGKPFRISIGDKEWEHHMQETNYSAMSTFKKDNLEKIWEGKKFIKIARDFPLQDLNSLITQLRKSNREILELLK